MPVWVVAHVKGAHDPDFDVLGAWSTKELADREAARLKQLDQHPHLGHTFEVSELTLDTPFPHSA